MAIVYCSPSFFFCFAVRLIHIGLMMALLNNEKQKDTSPPISRNRKARNVPTGPNGCFDQGIATLQAEKHFQLFSSRPAGRGRPLSGSILLDQQQQMTKLRVTYGFGEPNRAAQLGECESEWKISFSNFSPK